MSLPLVVALPTVILWELTSPGYSGISDGMRRVLAILGLFAMFLTLGVPVMAFTPAPCAASPMAMAEGAEPCQDRDVSCPEQCVDAAKCQSQCPSSAPVVLTPTAHGALLFSAPFHTAEDARPPGTISPVDSPPPRI